MSLDTLIARVAEVTRAMKERRGGMKTYVNTEDRAGLVVPFHTLEKGASAPRRPKDGPPIVVVVHYTACADLPRWMSATRTKQLIRRALDAGNVETLQAKEASLVADAFLQVASPNGPTAQVPDAIGQAAIAAASPREACAHYFVASCSKPLKDRSRESAALALTLPPPRNVVPVVEFVDPSRIAHHVGPLAGWTNRHSIGIEVCYPGPAPRKECKTQDQARAWFERRGWFVPETWAREVCLDGLSRWFAPLPEEVYRVVVGLVADLALSFPSISHVCSHYTFAPRKRINPDPPLSLHELVLDAGRLCGRTLVTTPPHR